MTEINQVERKALDSFAGRVVRKDIVQDIKSSVNVPTYVLEYLLGQYCATEDEDSLQEGIKRVKKILSKHYVRPDEAETVKSEIREKGKYRVIDKVKARLDLSSDAYYAHFTNLGLNNIEISEELVSKHQKLLSGGVWAIVDMKYTPEESISLFSIDNFKPIQISKMDISTIKDKRSDFTRDEWVDLLLQSMGYEPEYFDKRTKMLLISRMIPLCENNYNFVELGPRGTGKSYVYRELSPYSILISGGKTTVAKLFLNLNTGRVGLVGLWDTVAFDEVAGITFKDRDSLQILKDYMESGSFSRGTEEISARASMVYVGNIDLEVEKILKTSHLFSPFPEDMQDLAFIDRYHFYHPGWEIPKMKSEYFSDRYGFIVDYLAEYLRKLRKENYNDAVHEHFNLGNQLNKRDTRAVKKTLSGYLKILHPDGDYSKKQLEEYLKYAMEGRRRVKEQLKRIGGLEYRSVDFSYNDLETEQEKFVEVPEEAEEKIIPKDTPNPGTVYTIGKEEMENHLFRIETQSISGKGKKSVMGSPGKKMKECFKTAYDYLTANMRKFSKDDTLDDYNINVQIVNPTQGDEGGETSVAFLVGMISSILDKPVRPQLVVLGDMSIMGELSPVASITEQLQLAIDSGAKRVLIPAKNRKDFDKIPPEILDELELSFYKNPEKAVEKALDLE